MLLLFFFLLLAPGSYKTQVGDGFEKHRQDAEGKSLSVTRPSQNTEFTFLFKFLFNHLYQIMHTAAWASLVELILSPRRQFTQRLSNSAAEMTPLHFTFIHSQTKSGNVLVLARCLIVSHD